MCVVCFNLCRDFCIEASGTCIQSTVCFVEEGLANLSSAAFYRVQIAGRVVTPSLLVGASQPGT